MRAQKRQAKAITMIQLGVAGILLLLLVLLVYWYVEGISAYKPKTEVHQYFGGSELNYSSEAVFRDEKDSITVNDISGKMTIADTPLLYKGETKITLPCNMLLMVPSEGTALKRINYFTTVTESAGRITYTSGNKSAQSFGGFLYDGDDLYVFLEPTVLNIGTTYSVELPALSYVKVRYAQFVEYHNSATDEDKLVGINEVDVNAVVNDSYKINLSNDVIYTDMGEALLYSAVDKIAVIEMK
jgi:hypothetical protein